VPSKGRFGEQLACQYLLKKGYSIVSRNYRGKYGEIDIVCQENGIIVFVEVKSRTNINFGQPHEYITSQKIKRLRRVFQYYLSANKLVNRQLRFDIISIIYGKGCSSIDIKHFQDYDINL